MNNLTLFSLIIIILVITFLILSHTYYLNTSESIRTTPDGLISLKDLLSIQSSSQSTIKPIISTLPPTKATKKPVKPIKQVDLTPISNTSSKVSNPLSTTTDVPKFPALKPTIIKHLDSVKHEIPVVDHPNISPRKGTDISEGKHIEILQCPNQSSCIVPELQLLEKIKVYFCTHPVRGGVRFYFLTREGLLLHPNVILVEESEIDTAEYIIYLPGSAPWGKSEVCYNNLLTTLLWHIHTLLLVNLYSYSYYLLYTIHTTYMYIYSVTRPDTPRA